MPEKTINSLEQIKNQSKEISNIIKDIKISYGSDFNDNEILEIKEYIDDDINNLLKQGYSEGDAVKKIKQDLKVHNFAIPLLDAVASSAVQSKEQREIIENLIQENRTLENYLKQSNYNTETWINNIYNKMHFQFSRSERPIIEVLANGLDACETGKKQAEYAVFDDGFEVKDNGVGMDYEDILIKLNIPTETSKEDSESGIGRFGQGFYSIFSYLKNPGDKVEVETKKDGEHGYKATYSFVNRIEKVISDKKSKELENYQKNKFVKVEHIKDTDRYLIIYPEIDFKIEEIDKKNSGTTVRLKSEEFQFEEIEKVVEDYMKYYSNGDIKNFKGEVINIGQNLEKIKTKNGVSILYNYESLPNDEKSDDEKKENEFKNIKAAITIGGIKIENFDVSGTNLPDNFIIDLPLDINLTVSRDNVVVDKKTINFIKEAIDQIVENSQDVGLINAMYPLAQELQKRSITIKKEYNLGQYFKNSFDKEFSETQNFIPNTKEFGEYFDNDNLEFKPVDLNLIKDKNLFDNFEKLDNDIFNGYRNDIKFAPLQKNKKFLACENSVLINQNLQPLNQEKVAIINAYLSNIKKTESLKALDLGDIEFKETKAEEIKKNTDEEIPKIEEIALETDMNNVDKNSLNFIKFQEFLENIKEEENKKEQIKNYLDKNIKIENYEFDEKYFQESSVDELKLFGEKILLFQEKFNFNEITPIKNNAMNSVWQSLQNNDLSVDEFLKTANGNAMNLFLPTFEKMNNLIKDFSDYEPVDIHKFLSGFEKNSILENHIKEVNCNIATLEENKNLLLSLQDKKFVNVLLGKGISYVSFHYGKDKIYIRKSTIISQYIKCIKKYKRIFQNENICSNSNKKNYYGPVRSAIDILESISELYPGKHGVKAKEMISNLKKSIDDNERKLILYLIVAEKFGIYAYNMNGMSKNSKDNSIKNTEQLINFLKDDTIDFQKDKLHFIYDKLISRDSNIKDIINILPNLKKILIFINKNQKIQTYLYNKGTIASDRIKEIILCNAIKIKDEDSAKEYLELCVRRQDEFNEIADELDSGMEIDEKIFSIGARVNGLFKIAKNAIVANKIIDEVLNNESKDSIRTILKEMYIWTQETQVNEVSKEARKYFILATMDDKARHKESENEKQFTQNPVKNISLNAHYASAMEAGADFEKKPLNKYFDDLNKKEINQGVLQISRRNIDSSVHDVNRNPFIFSRELTQNALDECSRNPEIKQEFQIDWFCDKKDDLHITFKDFAGMDENTVMNDLLIPFKTTKFHEDDLTGKFGQGFFTIFSEAKEVFIKTKKQDEKLKLFKFTPTKNKQGRIQDIEISAAEVEDEQDFVGTEIEFIKKTKEPLWDVAQMKANIISFIRFVPDDEMDIKWQDQKINMVSKKKDLLSADKIEEYGDQELKIYFAKGEQAFTQNGLYIKDISKKYLEQMPEQITEIMKNTGMVIDVPAKIELLSSRSDFIDKEKTQDILHPYVLKGLLKSSLNLFMQEKADISVLPDDFFIRAARYKLNDYDEIMQEIVKPLENNKSIDNKLIKEFLTSSDDKNRNLGKIFANYKFIVIKNQKNKFSIVELINGLEKETINKNDLSEELFKKIFKEQERAKPVREQMEKAEVEQFYDREIASKEGIDIKNKKLGLLYATADLIYRTQNKIKEHYDAPTDIDLLVYKKYDFSAAHARQGGGQIGWNFDYFKEISENFKKVLDGFSSKNDLTRLFLKIIKTSAHELTHIQEDIADFTHDDRFYQILCAKLEKTLDKPFMDKIIFEVKKFIKDNKLELENFDFDSVKEYYW
ncbi:ATP-binding protein [Candidatus Parcubacteria bacterium]|nr:ATP-binding protein [Candidatus Parcubacteria bacterium]